MKRKYVTIQTLQHELKDKKKPNQHDQELIVGAGGAEIGGHDKRVSKNNEFKGNKKKKVGGNEKGIEEPKLKHQPASLETGNISNVKKKKTLEEEWADNDRGYVSGHDSLSVSEDEQEQRQPKMLELRKSATEIVGHEGVTYNI